MDPTRIRYMKEWIEQLPKGNITYKSIRGKKYAYLQWTENGKQRSRRVQDDELQELTEKIENYEKEINELLEQEDSLKKEINELEEQLNISQKNYNKQKELLEERLIILYEAGETSYLDVLLNSKGISDFISNYYLISEIAKCDIELL